MTAEKVKLGSINQHTVLGAINDILTQQHTLHGVTSKIYTNVHSYGEMKQLYDSIMHDLHHDKHYTSNITKAHAFKDIPYSS